MASGVANATWASPQSPTRLKTVIDVGRTVLGVVKDSADTFAPVKSVAGGLCAVIDVSQRIDATGESARQVADRASRLADALPSGSSSNPAANQLKSKRMESIQGRSWLGALSHLNRDESECNDASRLTNEYCHDFNTIAPANSQAEIVKVRHDVQNLNHMTIVIANSQVQTRQDVQNMIKSTQVQTQQHIQNLSQMTITVTNSIQDLKQ
ncbi:hypothetical protein H0H92_010362 [Tricholoma furcatifolium]|nr:hypothetical protein H0H92_010362 [Tricholoma furcatifolium]